MSVSSTPKTRRSIMGKLSTWLFGGKTPKVTKIEDRIVKTSIMIVKETVLNYGYKSTQEQNLDLVTSYKVGTYVTLDDGSFLPDYRSGYYSYGCKTEEEAQKAFDFLVLNKGKTVNSEILKESELPNK